MIIQPLLSLFFLACVLGGALASDPLQVLTQSGNVQGQLSTVVHSVREFLGIPYAQPPLNHLRWAAPQPAVPWAPATLDATKFSLNCLQGGSAYGPSGEDCLYLNVWTPVNVTAPLAVMVWIYGGSFVSGGTAAFVYNGARLAAENCVIVTLNYRLGACWARAWL